MSKRIVCLIFLLMCFMITTSYAANRFFTNVVVFGDSLSDIGNNTWFNATGTPITSIDSKGNRSLWVDYLAFNMFKKNAYASNKHLAYPLINNVSYAYAGADTSNNYLNTGWPKVTETPRINDACVKPGFLRNEQDEVISTCVPGLRKQVELYLSDVNNKPNKLTLFILWAGANDLFYNLTSGKSPEEVLQTTITNIVYARDALIAQGVSEQQIYIVNMPDLSKTPFAIKFHLEEQLAAISKAFNNLLMNALVIKNNPQLNVPGYHVIPVYEVLNNVLAHPEQYGLQNVTQSCVESGGTPRCEGFMFLDSKHVTSAMQFVIADEFQNIVIR